MARAPSSRSAELDWVISHARGKEFSASLLRLALAASLYHLWLDRNARVVSGGCLSSH